MTVIDSYLDTLFAPYPKTPRLAQAREELRAMMEDKLHALQDQGLTESQAVGQVIAEFGTLDEVASVLGIERELAGEGLKKGTPDPGPPLLTLERARDYADAVRRAQPLLAVAVPLFVLCPVPLLAFIAATGSARGTPGPLAIGGGLGLLLLAVAVGVIVMLARSSRLGDWEDITEGKFTATPQVRSFAQDLKREQRVSTKQALAIAIALWILAALPTILAALLAGPDSTLPIFGVCLTLIMVAAGLAIMLRHNWADSAADTLLHEHDDDPEASDVPAIRVIAALYWPLVVAAYLAISFIGNAWDRSWVIWPVAGVLYPALWAVNGALRGKDRSGRR